METIVDLTELPTSRDYAFWAFNNSDVEHYWDSFDEFFKCYEIAKKNCVCKLPEHKEYSLDQVLSLTVNMNNSISKELKGAVKNIILKNYWQNYTSKCFIKEDVTEILSLLEGRYKLGVISNFKVTKGIEDLLEMHNIIHYFDFIITSIDCGWRKPHPNIYLEAIEKSLLIPSEILLIGDDYQNDFIAPRKLGIRSLLFDRNNKYIDENDRITSFYDLKYYL
ncbi:HAD-IA family hydrolase [Bacillus sp. IITD106]|nr:HAD-IA family hydrolase [Bacillus sp. IITD106]